MDNWRSYAGVIEGEEEVIAKLEELGVGVKRTNEALTEAVEYLELNFIGFYGVLLEFEKRMSVNMQEMYLYSSLQTELIDEQFFEFVVDIFSL